MPIRDAESQPRPRSRIRSLAGVALLCLVAVFSPLAAVADVSPAGIVQAFYDALLAVMRNGEALGARGRYAQLEPAVVRSFDIAFMTRVAVGPGWAGLSLRDQQRVTEAFRRYVAAIYAERFQSYRGQRMEVLGEQSSPNGRMVTSRIVKADGQPVSISYLLRESQGTWRIADVYFEGSISEMATRRSEFAAVLRTGGIEGLIDSLNRKADNLGAS